MTYAVVWEHHAMNEFRRLRAIDPVGAKARLPDTRGRHPMLERDAALGV